MTIFRFRSFREVIDGGRAAREAEADGEGPDPEGPSGPADCRPERASRTSVTASGKTVAITWRICWACCSAVPCTLMRLIAATWSWGDGASWIALSAQASFC